MSAVTCLNNHYKGQRILTGCKQLVNIFNINTDPSLPTLPHGNHYYPQPQCMGTVAELPPRRCLCKLYLRWYHQWLLHQVRLHPLQCATTPQTGHHRVGTKCSMLCSISHVKNTVATYTSAYCQYLDFCHRSSHQAYPASENALCQFAGFLRQQNPHQTIKSYRYLSCALLSYCAIDCYQSPSLMSCPDCSNICPVRGKVC